MHHNQVIPAVYFGTYDLVSTPRSHHQTCGSLPNWSPCVASLQKQSSCGSSHRTLWYQFLWNLTGKCLNVSKPGWEICNLKCEHGMPKSGKVTGFFLSWLAYNSEFGHVLRVCCGTFCVKRSYLLMSCYGGIALCVRWHVAMHHITQYPQYAAHFPFEGCCGGLLKVAVWKAGPFSWNLLKFRSCSTKIWTMTEREICVNLREIAWSHDSGRDFAWNLWILKLWSWCPGFCRLMVGSVPTAAKSKCSPHVTSLNRCLDKSHGPMEALKLQNPSWNCIW